MNIKSPAHNKVTQYRWRDLFAQVLQYRKRLVTANIVAVITALISVPIPLLVPLLTDEVLLNQPGPLIAFMSDLFPEAWHGPVLYIVALSIAVILLRLVWLVFTVWQSREFTLISKEITFGIRKRLIRHIETVELAEYETLGSGTVSSRLVVDLETVDAFLGYSISKLIVSVLTLIGVTIVLLYLHWQLALFILLLNPFVILLSTKLGKRVKELKKQENSAFEVFQQALTETLDSILQIRSSNRSHRFFGHVTDLAADVKTHAGRFAWKSEAVNKLSFSVFISGFDVFRAASMLMVVFSDLTIGEMLAVFSYLWFMMGPVQEVLNIQYSWFGAKAALTRINSLLAMEAEPIYEHKHNPFTQQHTVSLTAKNIRFAYGERTPVLKDISLHIPAGQKVALVGASGGGKSTFVQVLLGLYQPQQGQLFFNDIPVTDIGLDVVREHVATVLQHPALFNDTIRANLTMGKQNVEDAQLWQALEIAQLDQTIREQEQGLDTIVGRNGMRLSGGQRQRLAIARMVLSDPKVVILDEATSALDMETEEKLHTAMDKFLEGRTTLIIAHRLSAVRQADKILVFEDGHISEQGSHDELLQQDGFYSQLYGNKST